MEALPGIGPLHHQDKSSEHQILARAAFTCSVEAKRIVKLLGLDYTIQYKKGVENKVANALSRQREGAAIHQLRVFSSSPAWLQEILTSYDNDELASKVIPSLLLHTELRLWSLQGGKV